ncbi:MAG TPA: secretin N-terminal domain-containing protein, partial [Campylobacterales bacterium]|nr:secretin N-terminal domain-containing protein [Campylobacterales bacterium]
MRLNSRFFAAATLFACISLFGAPQSANTGAKNDPVVEIGFADISLSDFVKTVSKITGKNILIATELQGKVDFVSQKPLRKSELYDLLISTLETKGYTIVSSEKGYLKVVPLADAVRSSPSTSESSFMPQIRTKVIKLTNLKAGEAQNAVRPLLSKSGAMQASIESNDIIVSDFPKNVDTIAKVISQMERDSEKKAYVTAVVNLKNGDGENIAKILNEILSKKVSLKDTPKPLISADAQTNSLIIIGAADEIAEIKSVVASLDMERQQVYVKAKIIELSDTKTREVGVKYGIQGAT